MQTHNIGFPRIGKKRELKFLLEQFWQGALTEAAFLTQCQQLRHENWQLQLESGIELLTVGDFAHYDHVLTTSLLFGAIPKRIPSHLSALETEFAIARGVDGQSACSCCAPSDMTKWFNTNYHYLVPELDQQTQFSLQAEPLLAQIAEAKSLTKQLKVSLLGPVSYLYLANFNGTTTANPQALSLLPQLLAEYQGLIDLVKAQDVEWLQIEEPILTLELDEQWQQALQQSYQALASSPSKILLTSYFGSISHQLELIKQLNVDGLHIDLVNETASLEHLVNTLPSNWQLSLGLIDGRNVFKADLASLHQKYQRTILTIKDRVWLASSCSLLHCPVDLSQETKLDKEIQSWLAFSVQKCQELALLKQAIQSQNSQVITQYSAPVLARLVSPKVHDIQLQQQLTKLSGLNIHRAQSYAERKAVQQQKFNLPLLPTTTIGSFPQTSEIRQLRSKYKRGVLDHNQYQQGIYQQIKYAIEQQEQLGLDVLVHGEAERNDMVEYFADYLNGCCTSSLGWVQSYGSRCVKPPIFYGDISRKQPITLDWLNYAQSLTDKPVKAMLTGPITIFAWSFIRDDLPAKQVCQQLALAIEQEVNDLVAEDHHIIQIDEPAIREKLPLKQSQWQEYLAWATECFRLTHYQVSADVQIHSHLCYSEFDDILDAIKALDVDVLTVETSRSQMAILSSFIEQNYQQDLGPGVYDIHSPNIPSIDWIEQLIKKALVHFKPEQLWLNPDCGLKTRKWPETIASLNNMVSVAQKLRAELAK